MLEGMTDRAHTGTWGRWRSWWLADQARRTTNPLTARGTAILARVTRSRAVAIVALAMPALLVASVAAAQLGHRSGSAHTPLAAAIVLSVLLTLPLLWRRRYPAATFTVLAVVALIQWALDARLGADVALLIALYVMFERSPARINWLAALVLGVGAVLAVLRWDHSASRLQTLVLLIATTAAVLFAGVAVRNRRTALAAAIDRGERLERERHQQALLDLAAERARVAREMHDIVAHGLLVMVRLADAAVAKRSVDPARSCAAMTQVAATGREALTDMRRLLGVLRTDSHADADTGRDSDGDGAELRPQPGLAELETLFEQVRATGLHVESTATGVASELGPGVELVVYRTVQEALTNVLKHAHYPTRARVSLTYGPEQIEIEINDDGDPPPAGSDWHAGDRHGLSGMAERVAAYDGRVHAGPAPVRGWALRATVPTPNGSTLTEQP